MYLIVAIVTYRYAGADVKSPALGSTSPMVQKVAYGIAIPTILVAGVINGHVAAKYVYVRLFRGTDRMSKKSWGSFGIWVLIVVILWTMAWIIAEAIPVFNDLLGLISALFASWFTYGLSGVFWLYMNQGLYFSSKRKMALTVVNSIIFLMGAVIVSFVSSFVPYVLCSLSPLCYKQIPLMWYIHFQSADSDFMRQEKRSMRIQRAATVASRARTIQNRLPDLYISSCPSSPLWLFPWQDLWMRIKHSI